MIHDVSDLQKAMVEQAMRKLDQGRETPDAKGAWGSVSTALIAAVRADRIRDYFLMRRVNRLIAEGRRKGL